MACSFFLVCAAAAGAVLSSADSGVEGLMPTVEVSLDPPADPQPAVAARIAKFEGVREMQQAARIENINRKFNAVLAEAAARINSLVSRSQSKLVSDNGVPHSFLQARSRARLADDDVAFVSIRAHPARDVDGAVLDDVAEFYNVRGQQEDALFERAAAGLQSLSDMLIAEAEAALQGTAIGKSQALFAGHSRGISRKRCDFSRGCFPRCPVDRSVPNCAGDGCGHGGPPGDK